MQKILVGPLNSAAFAFDGRAAEGEEGEVMADPTPEEIEADRNERTTAVGLYHYALSYRAAADQLGKTSGGGTHPDAPREFLYYHALELLLKAYLRNAGLSVMDLKEMSHSTGRLMEAFGKHGGFLADEDREALTIMDKTNAVLRSRYIVNGYFQAPAMQALVRTAINLSETVRAKLKGSGLPVR